ncbi:UvrD-helicase domain-containing protein [Streptomyces tirandamycinicus]|nr:UvrD-helicase domain-containing protein [Streptomyces tirandamycinicus]
MQITNAADRIAARLEAKRTRRPWNPDLHPRDSKGRFIETGGIARLWGGGMARVVRALGGRNVLVENVATRERSTVHASRLTMVARPDGSKPTKSKKKVRDEDERRTADPRRGTGRADDDDEGDQGDTPDDPHDKDDEGEDIGEDVEGVDLGEGPEPEDDDPVLPRGRVFQDGQADEENPQTARFDALPISGGLGRSRARHRHGQGSALRAPGPKAKGDERRRRFTDSDHAQAATEELVSDYMQPLDQAWDDDWDDDDARSAYEDLSRELSSAIQVNADPNDQVNPAEIDDLPFLAESADDLARRAEEAGKDDIAEAAATLADALELAHTRFEAHGNKPIPRPRANRTHGNAWEPQAIKPAKKAVAAKPQRRRDPNRRFKTLDDVRAHWAGGQLRPFSKSEDAQQKHNAAMPELMDQLDKPQLSRNGHFTIGKLPAKKPTDGPYGWAVIHNDTGMRMVTTSRKAEALDFANRMETAELDGKLIDWDDPNAFDVFNTSQGMDLARRLSGESRQAFADRAAKKRESATSRTQPAPATPEQLDTPQARAAQQIAEQSGAPASSIAVGHVGASTFGDERGRPQNNEELREFWKRGGSDDVPESQRDVMRRLASDPTIKLHLADHRGFAIIERTNRDDEFRFEVRASGTGRSLSGLGTRGIHSYGKFADRDTADRFTLFLASNLRHEDGRTVDWGGPRLNTELSEFRDKDGQRSGKAIWHLAGRFDSERGANDGLAAVQYNRRRDQEEAERQAASAAPEQAAQPDAADSPQTAAADTGDEERTEKPQSRMDAARAAMNEAFTWAGAAQSMDDAPRGGPLVRMLSAAEVADDDEIQHRLKQFDSALEELDRETARQRKLPASERNYLRERIGNARNVIREAIDADQERAEAEGTPSPDSASSTSGEDRPRSQQRNIAAAELDIVLDQMILAQRGTLQDDETSSGQIERARALIDAVRDGEADSAADLGEILAEVEQAIRGRQDGLDESSKRYWLNELAEARNNLMGAEARLAERKPDDKPTRDQPSQQPADTGADRSEQVRQAGPEALGDVPSGSPEVPGQRGGADGVLRDAREPGARPNRRSRRAAASRSAAGDDAGRDGVADAGAQSGDGDRAERGSVPAEGARDGAPGAGRDAAADVDAPRFRPGSQEDLAPSGERGKAKANVAAVQTLRRIQAENRPATEEEQQILARWSGWGALPVVLSDKPNPQDKRFRDEDGQPNPEAYARALKRWESFAEERAEVRALLDDKEWAAARKNTLNAHYTDAALIQPVWDALRSLGFRRGRVLEPGSGSGNFIGHAPDGAEMVGIELDPTSAAISQLLYPDAQIINQPFQDLRLPPDSFDLAVGNVPFGKYKLHDPLDNPGRHHSIHDHFILKSLARVRPGGYVALVTSRYTMDSEDDSARRAMYDMADLVGAVRLPEGAHQRAAGTHVVTDLLLFRRREPSEYRHGRGDDSWLTASKTNIDGHEHAVNDYFQQNPKNILGQLAVGRGQFTDHDLTVRGDSNTLVSLRAALGRIAADAKSDGKGYDASQQNAALSLNLAGDARDGTIARGEGDSFMTVEDGNWVELDVHPGQRAQLGRLLELKGLSNRLIELEASTRQTGETNEMREARAALNRAYDAYVRKHPSPNKPGQRRQFSPPEALARRKAEGLKEVPDEWKLPTALALFEEDPDGHMVFGLDRWDADAKAPRKLNILTERVLQPREIPDRADTPEDAVAIALEQDGGRLELPTVARLLGMDQDAAREALADLAFDDPATGRLESRAAYLSGNVRQKLAEARAAAAEDPKYAVNVAALERVVPRDIRAADIRVKIGAPWVPIDVYEGFLRHLGLSDASVTHFGGNRWAVDGSDKGEIARTVWGVKGRNAYELFDSLLHQKLITITESQKLPDGSTKTYVNQKATSAARNKAKEMAKEFNKWVMADQQRAERLGRIYNDKFNSIALRDYDETPLTLPGVKTGWQMRPHQNAAIRRITQEPTTLLGHVVGAGKTATMVGGAMELRRTGLASKPAIVVPNHMLEQFSREAVQLYPGAKVLAISRKDLHHKKRRKFIAKIAGGDWDVVVLTHDAFNSIPMTPKTQQAYMDKELALLRSQIEKIKARDGDDPSLKQMEQTLANQEEKLKERLETLKDERGIFFENTGIDYLFVDEAHEYKNLRTVSNLPGAAISGSSQATQLHMALGYLREHNASGRVASLATGTPIANSVTEAYVLMRYLAPHILEEAGIDDFDSWAATFGEVVTSLELAADGSGDYREKARFARFFNVPELLLGYRTFADIQTAADLNLPTPPVRAGENGRRGEVIAIPSSVEQRRYVQSLQDEDWIREPGGILKAIGFASRAAIDMRLQGGSGHEGGKLEAAAEQIARIYEEHKDTVYPVSTKDATPQELPGSLQLVFLDEGTPGSTGKIKFDAYEAMRDELVAAGVPREKVRFIHEAKDDKAKAKLFEEARNGKIAVLIGSTQKMGTGTNVQDRAVALHHLSFPWRPADMAQRDGRVERQGNLNVPGVDGTPDDVRIMYYITEGTFDEFRLGTLERKAVFINQMARRDFNAREMEDIGDDAVSMGTFKAIASGNPAIAERALAQGELVDLQRQNADWYEQQQERRDRIARLDGRIESLERALPEMREALAQRQDVSGDNFQATIGGVSYDSRADAAQDLGQRMADIAKDTRHRDGATVPLGEIGGVNFLAEVEYDADGNRMVRLRLDHAPSYTNAATPDTRGLWSARKINDTSGRGAIQSLENLLKSLDADIEKRQKELDQARVTKREAESHLEEGQSPFEEQVASTERRVQALTEMVMHHQEAKKLRERIHEAGEKADPGLRKRLKEVEEETRVLKALADQERARTFKPAPEKPKRAETAQQPAPQQAAVREDGRPRPSSLSESELDSELSSIEEAINQGTADDAAVDRHARLTTERARRARSQPADSTTAEQREGEAASPRGPETGEGTVTLDPAKVRSELNGLAEEGTSDESAGSPGETGTTTTSETSEPTTKAPETEEQPAESAPTPAPTQGTGSRDEAPASGRQAPADRPREASPRAAGEDSQQQPAAGSRPERSSPAGRPTPQPSATDMDDEQLADAIGDLEEELSGFADSTDRLDLARRRRMEQRLFELQEEERRRWTPEPEYDDNGKLVERSRGSVVRDRLEGYGLNNAEVEDLVTRVEDLPAAKPGGYSDEEWERIDAAAAANESYPPTDEQDIIIQGAARRGLNMAVMALAGTGKSSTLKMLSHRMPGKKIVYLAFNRSVAAEAREAQARGEYAKNMLASTANAYAARVADRRLNDRLPSNKKGGFKKLNAQQIADRMRWYDTVRAGGRELSPGGAATVAERMLQQWAKSADAEMGPQHVNAKTEEERRDLFNAVKPLADRMWANLTDPEAGDPERDLTMDFDYIVKQWALGGYKLDADTLFWDEAQDVNPVMEGVVRAALDQGVQVVAVGDSNQAIYGFRGASDALTRLPVDARATLTQSFRFGPAVADVGNRFLRLLGTRMRLRGYDRKDSHLGQLQPGEESMVIARTNAGVALAAVQSLAAGRTVAVSGGVKALQEFVLAARALAAGENTDHAELARFNGMAYDDILEEVKTDPDLQQLASLFSLLEKHGDDIDLLLSSGARPAETELVGDRVWVRMDWNDPEAAGLREWFRSHRTNGVGRITYDANTKRFYYQAGKRTESFTKNGRTINYQVDNKLSLEEAKERIDAHLARVYPQTETEEGRGRLVPEHEKHDVLVTTAHKAKGLESERVRIADDFTGPEETDDGNIDWDTIPDDEALRVAYVAVTRATEVLDPGSLGWVFRAVRDDDPTQPPKGEYRRDFELGDFQPGDEIDFQEEDGTPNIGVVSEIDPPVLSVLSTSDEPGVGGKRQEIGPAQVQRRNGQGRPLLDVASDEELDAVLGEDTARAARESQPNADSAAAPQSEEPTGSPAVPAPAADIITGDQVPPGPGATPYELEKYRRRFNIRYKVGYYVDYRNDDGETVTARVVKTTGNPILRDDAGHEFRADPDWYADRFIAVRADDGSPLPRPTWADTLPEGFRAVSPEEIQPGHAIREGSWADLLWGKRFVMATGTGEDGSTRLYTAHLATIGGVNLGYDPRQLVVLDETEESRQLAEEALRRRDVRKSAKFQGLTLPKKLPAPSDETNAPDAPTPAPKPDNAPDADTSSWGEGDQVLTPQHGAGAIRHIADNGFALVDTDSGMRPIALAELRRPGQDASAAELDRKAEAGAKRERENAWLAAAATSEGAPIESMDGYRLANLDVDAGHGAIMRDGEMVAWIRARGPKGASTWKAQDARGGGPRTPAAAISEGTGENGLYRSIKGAAWSAAYQADSNVDPSHGRGVTRPEDMRGEILGTLLTKAQFRELGDLAKRWANGDDADLRHVANNYYSGPVSANQMRYAADAIDQEADALDLSTADGRRREKLYRRLAQGVRWQARGLEASATMPPPGEPDPFSRRGDAPAPDAAQAADTEVGNGPEEIREKVGEHNGKPVEVGEVQTIPAESRFQRDEVRRSVYLDGERIGSLLHSDAEWTGGDAWRADHDLYGSVGDQWYRQGDFDNPGHAAALALAGEHGKPLLSFPGDRSGRAEPIREWAGVWAEPQPAGVRNVYLDRALAHNGDGWTATADPWQVRFWISTMADVEPSAQYDENTRRSLEEVPQEARQYLAGLVEELRSSVQKAGEELRADLRPLLVDRIATRNGRKKALELRNQLAEERTQKVRELVREQVARARVGAEEHGLSEQQAEDFLVSVVGGDNPDQTTYGIRGEFPEALRPLQAAVADARAYWAAFAGWATQDDSGNWAGMHWENGRRESLGAPMIPAADARSGTGELRIGEAELPRGMRWVRGSELGEGHIFHTVSSARRGTADVFDGMEPPHYVIHTHRNGREGEIRSVSLDSDRGSHTVGAEEWVVLVEKPEPAVRKRAQHRARTDVFTNWGLPKDHETYELGGPDRVAALVARADVAEVANDGSKKEWSVSVDGVDVGRIAHDWGKSPTDYHAESADGQRRTWSDKDLATAGLVAAYDAASRDEQEGNRRDDENDENDGQDGQDDADAERRRRNRRRRRDRDRNRPESGGDTPGGARPVIPRVPGRNRDDDDDDGRDSSGNQDEPRRLEALKNRYRSGEAPVPSGADPERHAQYLRGLASNDSLTLSPGGGLVTWTNTGDTWRFGHAASGLHLEGWEVSGDAIGGREGARRLAGAYEGLRDADGELIDWTSPVLDPERMRAWSDADGMPLAGAVARARQNMIDLRSDESREASGPDAPAAPGRTTESGDAAPRRPGDDSRGRAGTAAVGGAQGTTQGEGQQGADTAAPGATAEPSQYVGNAVHGPQHAGSVDGRRIPTAEELKRYESRGSDRVINEEGERALFGSPEQMRALAEEGFVPGPLMRSDRSGQVWRNGRLIGNLNAPHRYRNDHTDGDPEVWWSELPFGSSGPHFATREAAIAHLVLRDKERGEPDLSIVHPDLARDLSSMDDGRALDGRRGLESLENRPEDMERLQALRDLLAALGRGETPSGNVADDLARLHDELRWLNTHYKQPPTSLKEANIHGPGWLADEIRKHLDVLRPEDPRAQHHEARLNRAAHQALNDLLADGARDRADRVPAGDIREGDIVHLSGRISGRSSGATASRTGYVIGEPQKATLTTDGKRQRAWRITVGGDPWEATRHAIDTETFVIPVDGSGLVLARAEDVNMPFDDHRYGRREGEAPRDTAPARSGNGADREPAGTPAAPGSAADRDQSGDRAEEAQPTSAGGAADNAPSSEGDSSNAPSDQDDRQEADPSAGKRTQGGRPKGEEPASEGDTTPADSAAPEPVGGRPAEWVKVSDLTLGDLVRVDGTTKRGTARTLAGYVVDGPKSIPTTQARRLQDMYRVLIADAPDSRDGKPVWVRPDAAAARATRDDADQFQGSPQTGADSDVLTGRIADRVPTDRNANGLFPGAIVTNDDGREGVVTGASANSVRVQFGDDRTDDDHAPTSLNVTDGGAARPDGWTTGGHRVRPGNIVSDRDGNMLGTVEDVDGDTATVAAPQGMAELPIGDLRVVGDTSNGDGQAPPKVARVESVTAGELKEGDLLVPRNGRPRRITSIRHTGTRTTLDTQDPIAGDIGSLSVPSDAPMRRAVDAEGGAPDFGPEDEPESPEPIVPHEPAPAVAPVNGPTVNPDLSPEERDAITDRGQVPTDDPEAQQAAARIANDLPVTAGQASALAGALREGADASTSEGRAARRAADHLDAAAGNESDGGTGRPEPGTIGAVGVGDTLMLPDEFDPDTMTAYRVVQIQEAPGGMRTLMIEDEDGLRFKRTFASGESLYQLPEPSSDATAAQDDDGDTPATSDPAAPAVPVARVQAGQLRVGDVIDAPLSGAGYRLNDHRRLTVVAPPHRNGWWMSVTVMDGDGNMHDLSLHSGRQVNVFERNRPTPALPPADGNQDASRPSAADRIRADYGDAVVRGVIDNAIQGTTTPGSIHQLREQIAAQLTPESLRSAMSRVRNEARDVIDGADLDDTERDELVSSLRPEAASARQDAVRAVLRTVNDLEPRDGESEEELAARAADLLRLIPEALRNRPDNDRDGDSIDGDSRVDRAVLRHVDDAVGEALADAVRGGELTEERRAAIVAQLAARLAATREETARRIASQVPEGRRPGVFAHALALLVAIARKLLSLLMALLKWLARVVAKAWRAGRNGTRSLRERLARFRRNLMERIKSWPETRRLRRLAAAADLPEHGDGLPLGDRVAHWARLLPAPGRFGQVSRRSRWYRPASRTSLAAGQLPAVRDGVRWAPDRAVDGGPGPQALRHLAAVRAAGQDVDTDVAARLAAAAPELGDDPHGNVRHASGYADAAERRLRDLEAAAAGGATDTDLEIAAARVEAQSARQEATRLQQAYTAALPDAVRDTLAELREMGPGTTATLVTTPDSDRDSVRALTDISQFVPRDWLTPADSRFIGARGGDTGGYDPDSRIATVADLGDGGRRTAAHALLAHLQQHYPDLLAAQEAFHFTRTHSGRVGARRRTSVDVLMARLFRNRTEQGDTGDVVPLGLGTLFSGDWYEDDDLRAFLLGLLATR